MMPLREKITSGEARIAVIGLGYVGLPLAVEFGKRFDTIGFDIKPRRLEQLRQGIDNTLETAPEDLKASSRLRFSGDPEELRDRAGSLAMVTGRRIDRPKVAAAMMEALANMDRNLLTGKEAMLEQYRRDCVTLGQKISVVRGDEIRHGTALDIGNDGDLIVRFDDGHTEAVSSGEVSIRGMYGYV